MVDAKYEYVKGKIRCTMTGEGPAKVVECDATLDEWARAQMKLAEMGFSFHGKVDA